MSLTLADHLSNEGHYAEALRIYAKIDRLESPETQRVLLETGDAVGRYLGVLVSIHACDGCGASISDSEGFCERCGNSDDGHFERL